MIVFFSILRFFTFLCWFPALCQGLVYSFFVLLSEICCFGPPSVLFYLLISPLPSRYILQVKYKTHSFKKKLPPLPHPIKQTNIDQPNQFELVELKAQLKQQHKQTRHVMDVLLALTYLIRCYDVSDSIDLAMWCDDPSTHKDGDGNSFVIECCKDPLCNNRPLAIRSSLPLTGFL